MAFELTWRAGAIGGAVQAGLRQGTLRMRTNGDRNIFILTGHLGFFMFMQLPFLPAHDDDDIPGSLGASTATDLQQLGKDRTLARPQNACA